MHQCDNEEPYVPGWIRPVEQHAPRGQCIAWIENGRAYAESSGAQSMAT